MKKLLLIAFWICLFGFNSFCLALTPQEDQELRDYTNREPANISDAKKLVIPRRDFSVIATDHGYYPENFSVFVGEKVRFFVTAASDNPSCFILKSHELFLSAKKGRITEGEALFDKPGKYMFHCPSGKISGKVTVLKRPIDVKRKVASSDAYRKPGSIWMPRDF